MKALLCLSSFFGWLLVGQASFAAELHFETDIRPILKAHCFHCHGEEEKLEGKLDLRLVRTMLAGGESGPALVAGKAADSLLLQRIANDEMPPAKKKLTTAEKAMLTRWIEQGAKTKRAEPEKPLLGEWTDEERSYWAFQPIRRVEIPAVKQPALLGTAVDAFLLAKLEAEGLSFSPAADRRTLIRRLSFDLLGLPPNPEEVDAFVSDPAPDAYPRLVDAFLASPAYGERWGRHWLDVAGYADSDGYTDNDHPRPWAFRYRDYVIKAFNADKPWDTFIVEQLAGDELVSQPFANLTPQQAELLSATGFLRMAPDGTGDGGVDQNVARNEVVAETIKIVSSSLLGISVGCAQCHNHRYDPVSQVDYYRLRAVFEPALDWKNWRPPAQRQVNLWTAADHEEAAKIDVELKEIEKERVAELNQIVADIFEKEIAKLPEEKQPAAREAKATAKEKRTPEQKQLLMDHPSLNVDGGSAYLYEPQKLKEFNAKYELKNKETKERKPPESFVACLSEPVDKRPPTHLFYRGDFNQPRQSLLPGDLSVLGERAATIAEDDPQLPTSGRRLALAKHLASGKQPLVPRVLVNRFWMHHFGRGLVATPAEFGQLGERPSHPELLDWLADEFVARGWSLKDLHRLLLLSTAYQQVSTRSPALQSKDPENRWLGRMSVRRLEAEAIRDAVLELTGQRHRAMFGPAATVNPDEVGQVIIGKATRDGNGILVAKGDDPEQFRRTIYVQVRRSMPLGMLEPFDIASTAPNCELRPSSTVAPQALLMMNSDFVVKQAERFAQRLANSAGEDSTAAVKLAWQLTYGSDPKEAELTAAVDFLNSQRAYFAQQPKDEKDKTALAPSQQALAVLCQVLVSSNRFLYVD